MGISLKILDFLLRYIFLKNFTLKKPNLNIYKHFFHNYYILYSLENCLGITLPPQYGHSLSLVTKIALHCSHVKSSITITNKYLL